MRKRGPKLLSVSIHLAALVKWSVSTAASKRVLKLVDQGSCTTAGYLAVGYSFPGLL